ncbi:CubicO group peptidase, beta-lactamase class C family [Micromonospora peucetia]|uniref:CubicO group peptidase, beta-lactamase class C family n=2 Tax=Micromonospora peucetia TaxID=47871 RepID=A0A1C6VPM2_9ACTN|nr:CubicO group peptidase, beta-lactamase class C family [Micromonospora peucetia]
MMRRMPLHRRTVLGAGLAAAAATLTGCREAVRSATAGASAGPVASASASASAAPSRSAARVAAVPEATGPTAEALHGGAQAAGRLRFTLNRHLAPTSANPKHPAYTGAVALCQMAGATVAKAVVGKAVRYAAGPVLLPGPEQVWMRYDSIFDLASITKVYTAILTLQQVDKGRIDLSTRVADHLPGFTGAGKEKVTVAMLLAHTSGLPVGAKVTGLPDDAARRKAVLATSLVSGAVPGTVYRYSSVGLMVLAFLVEKLTGQRFDQALKTGLTGPLGLRDTGFNPKTWLSTADQAARLVATDARSTRGLLRGVVHDDVANHMGGVAGHAGIFSTAAEVAVIGQLLLGGGVHNGTRILSEEITRQMLANVNTGLPAVDPERPHRTSAHGLGVVLDQPWFMGRLSGPRTFGHTGFTGTSLVVDPDRRMVLVLLTNRAHPNWSWANPDPVRVDVAEVVATIPR